MTTKTKALSDLITSPLELIKGAGGKISLKSVVASDVRVKTDIVKRKNKHGVRGSSHKTINSVGVMAEITLVSTAGFESSVKVAYVSRAKEDTASSLNKSMTVYDVVSNAELEADFFQYELGDDVVERHSITITNEDFRERLLGIESSLCQYWEDENEKGIYIDNDNDVTALLREYHNAFATNPEVKDKRFTKKLLAEINAAVKASALKFLSE